MPMCFARPPAASAAPVEVIVRIVDEPASPVPATEKHVQSIEPIAYQGAWREGKTYQRGQFLTFGGSMWHVDRATDARPNTPDSGYTLAVKRGRDGKASA